MTTQPEWTSIVCTDYYRILVDSTGVYDPEMEYIQECDGTVWLYRFSPDKYKVVDGYMGSYSYDRSWPYPPSEIDIC